MDQSCEIARSAGPRDRWIPSGGRRFQRGGRSAIASDWMPLSPQSLDLLRRLSDYSAHESASDEVSGCACLLAQIVSSGSTRAQHDQHLSDAETQTLAMGGGNVYGSVSHSTANLRHRIEV